MAESVEGGETITIVALAGVRECFSGPFQTRIRCTTVLRHHQSRNEERGRRPISTVDACDGNRGGIFFPVYFYFVLSFLKVKPPYQHGHQPAARKCLFVFVLLLLSSAPYLFCSSTLSLYSGAGGGGARGPRPEARVFLRTFPVYGAARGDTEARGKRGSEGSCGKEG